MRLDVAIIGDTQDAWAAADEAASRGYRVAVLRPDFDGQGTGTGIAAVTATFNDSMEETAASREASPRDLWLAATRCHERHIREFCRRSAVQSSQGQVRITSSTTVEVCWKGTSETFEASLLLIAVGSSARRPNAFPFDQQSILVPEDVQHLTRTPSRLIVLGGNRTARAFGRLFQRAGSKIIAIDGPSRDQQADHSEVCHRGEVIELRQSANQVTLRLSTQEEVTADSLLFAADRVGATSSLNLTAAGLETDEDGRLWCDSSGYTWIPTIAAAGDVVGFPKGLRERQNSARKLINLHFNGGRQASEFSSPSGPLKLFSGTT